MERIEVRLWIILSFHCHNVFIYCLFNEREIFFKTLKNHNESQIDNKPIREMAQLYKNNLYFRDIRKNCQIKYIFELYSSNSIRR